MKRYVQLIIVALIIGLVLQGFLYQIQYAYDDFELDPTFNTKCFAAGWPMTFHFPLNNKLHPETIYSFLGKFIGNAMIVAAIVFMAMLFVAKLAKQCSKQ